MMKTIVDKVSNEEVARYYVKSEIGNGLCDDKVKDFDIAKIESVDKNTLETLVKTLSECRRNNIYSIIYLLKGYFSLCEWQSSELTLTDVNSKVIAELTKVKNELENFAEVVKSTESTFLEEFKDKGRVVENTKLIIRKCPNINGGRVIDGCHRAVVLYQRGSRTFEGYTFFG